MYRACKLWSSCRKNPFKESNIRQLSSQPLLDIKPEIRDAIRSKRAVVALESTIITHGMPAPYNLKTAIEVEEIVRAQGAIPATIAILRGQIKIGLSRSELEELADCKASAVKTSRRDLAYVLSRKQSGGTTVAGTLICANLCGIKLFATGGIGGVHRDGENTLDISADLIEMGRSAVAVVSSGIKSILDIPRTLEFLETQGVCVATFQCSDSEFPAFYTRSSGARAQYNFDDYADAAACINKSIQLGLNSSTLIGVPVPNEHAMDGVTINNAIERALKEAEEKGIGGKEVTPYLLAAISEITGGRSLQTNMALIKENARVAAGIAVELEKLQRDDDKDKHEDDEVVRKSSNSTASPLSPSSSISATPLVIGGSIVDVHYRVNEETTLELNAATYRATTTYTPGGVARNIAEGLYKLASPVTLISAFGRDQNGEYLRSTLPADATRASRISETRATASCAIILDKSGDCKLHVGDMEIHREITPELIYANARLIESTPLVCIDANLSHEAIDATLALACRYNKPVFYEPTDVFIADKPFQLAPERYRQIKFMTPNVNELRKIAQTLDPSAALSLSSSHESVLRVEDVAQLCGALLCVVENIVVTVGSDGVVMQRAGDAESEFFSSDLHYTGGRRGRLQLRHYPSTTVEREVKSSSGAGDAFCAGFIAAMLGGESEAICVSVGFQASLSALRSVHAVPQEFFNNTHACWRTPAKFNVIAD